MFCQIFISFLESTKIFDYFENKKEVDPKLLTQKNRDYFDVKKILFQNTLQQSTC